MLHLSNNIHLPFSKANSVPVETTIAIGKTSGKCA